MTTLLAVHIFITFFMTGLCWFVQVVHYPLFYQIDLSELPRYEKKNAVTGFITVPMMVIELLTGLVLLYTHRDLLFLTNVFFLGIIGLSTVVFQVPTHLKLMNTASRDLIAKLIRTNWIRTIGWTIRCGLLFYILARTN